MESETSFLDHVDPMNREHGAWMDMCKELRARGIAVNDNEANGGLVRAIKKWGEELVNLRVQQDGAVVERALAEARNDYVGQYERGEYPESGA